MSSVSGLSFAVATLLALTPTGLSAPTTPTAPGVAAASSRTAEADRTALPRTRLEVWASPQRVPRLKAGRSRVIHATAMETMAEWREVQAVIGAHTTAGTIRPKRARTSKGHPATFRLTRKPGDDPFGFVTMTAKTRKYGTAQRVISWGPVRLPRTLTGQLTYVDHAEYPAGGDRTYSHSRGVWNVTFRLVTRSYRQWMGAALYRLTEGTWIGEERWSRGGESCAGLGTGPAATGMLRYDWRGTVHSSGAGIYLIDAAGKLSYSIYCNDDPEPRADTTPAFSLGFEVATGGIRPGHLRGVRIKRERWGGPGSDIYQRWTWDLTGS